MAEETLDEGLLASVLFHQSAVLGAELVAFVGLHGNFAFELADVFCKELARKQSEKIRPFYLFFGNGKHVRKPYYGAGDAPWK